MISPFEGKVSLPPQNDPIVIKLCNENNERLTRKVAELNSKIKSLQKTQKLSNQQIELLQQTMVDTIIYYQNMVESLTGSNDKSNSDNTALREKIKQLEEKNVGENIGDAVKKMAAPKMQLNIFDVHSVTFEEIRKLLNDVDINRLTPVEALLKLQEIKSKLQ
jgi:hypothetical protein